MPQTRNQMEQFNYTLSISVEIRESTDRKSELTSPVLISQHAVTVQLGEVVDNNSWQEKGWRKGICGKVAQSWPAYCLSGIARFACVGIIAFTC